MDSSVSLKDEIWFVRVSHHISKAVYEFYENFTIQKVIRGFSQSYKKCPKLCGLLHALYTAHNTMISKLSPNLVPTQIPPSHSFSTKYSALLRFIFLVFQRSVLSPTHLPQKDKRTMCGNIYVRIFSVSLQQYDVSHSPLPPSFTQFCLRMSECGPPVLSPSESFSRQQ